MHDFLRDLALEHAPRRLLQSVLAGSAFLMLVGITGPEHWLTRELRAAAMDKAEQVDRMVVGVMQDWLEQQRQASEQPTPAPAR